MRGFGTTLGHTSVKVQLCVLADNQFRLRFIYHDQEVIFVVDSVDDEPIYFNSLFWGYYCQLLLAQGRDFDFEAYGDVKFDFSQVEVHQSREQELNCIQGVAEDIMARLDSLINSEGACLREQCIGLMKSFWDCERDPDGVERYWASCWRLTAQLVLDSGFEPVSPTKISDCG